MSDGSWTDLLAKSEALVAKLDECAPHVANLSVMNYVRSGTQYTGPSYGEALEALRAAIAPLAKARGES